MLFTVSFKLVQFESCIRITPHISLNSPEFKTILRNYNLLLYDTANLGPFHLHNYLELVEICGFMCWIDVIYLFTLIYTGYIISGSALVDISMVYNLPSVTINQGQVG